MDARRRLLDMVAAGRLTAEEALTLWDALAPEGRAALEEVPARTPEALPRLQEHATPEKWFRVLSWVLSSVGLMLTVGAFWGLFWSGAGWALGLFCLAPLGLVGLGLLWSSWRGVWLAVAVRPAPEEGPRALRFALPLPAGLLPWALRLARPWREANIPLESRTLGAMMRVLREEPLSLTVEDDDGTQVRLWIGHPR